MAADVSRFFSVFLSFVFLQLYHSPFFGNEANKPLLLPKTQASSTPDLEFAPLLDLDILFLLFFFLLNSPVGGRPCGEGSGPDASI